MQHPRGEKKQVALRENRIVDIPERFLHYSADTEPGSSGSLVFNDQWEAVALHHASVPAPERRELGGFVNEGVRISRIIKFIKEQQLPPDQRALAEQLFAPERVEAAAPVRAAVRGRAGRQRRRRAAHGRSRRGRRGDDHRAGPDHRAGRRRGRRGRAGGGDLDRPGLHDARRL